MIMQFKTLENSLKFKDLPTRFPFRVCYAVTHGEDQQELLHLLRYAIVCPFTDTLIDTLKRLIKYGDRELGGKQRPEEMPEMDCVREINKISTEGWSLVVPVYPETSAESAEVYNGRKPLTRGFRSNIWENKYRKPCPLPMMALHLPERVIPNLCVACLNVVDMQSGICSPGSTICQQQMNILVKDNDVQ